MSYPQYPGGYNPYPAYSTGSSAPSGATAITAGVLAAVGAVAELFGGGLSLAFGFIGSSLEEYDTTGLFSQSWYQTWALVSGALGLVIAVLLGVGAVAMFSRKSFGRVLVVVGCAATIATGVAGTVLFHSLATSSDSLSAISGGIGGLLGLIFPVATAVLALLPATSRWLAHTPVAAVPQQYPYPGPPQPGTAWPQPGAAAGPGQEQQSPVPQVAWGQPGSGQQPGQPGDSAGQAPWQQGAPAGGPVAAGQTPWQQAAAGSPPVQPWPQAAAGTTDKPSPAPQPRWGAPVPQDQLGGPPSVPQPSWGAPAQSELPSEPQPSWGAPAQTAPPSEPPAGWGTPAAIGRNDETVLRPPSSVPPSAPEVPPHPAEDAVRRPPPA